MNEPKSKNATRFPSAFIVLLAPILPLAALLAFKSVNDERYRLGIIEKDDWVSTAALVDLGIWCAAIFWSLLALVAAFLSIRRTREFLDEKQEMQPPDREEG